MKGYTITTDLNEMDINVIHSFLTASYWATGIPIETVNKAMQNSLCFAVLLNRTQVGFARLITDSATYAYLADVFILKQHRGKGLSKQLMETILKHPQLQGLRRIVLATRDAHQLYKKYGFTELANPQTFMELWTPNVYQKDNGLNKDNCK